MNTLTLINLVACIVFTVLSVLDKEHREACIIVAVLNGVAIFV